MSHLQSVLDEAVEAKRLPFVVASVANRDGIVFEGAAGEAAPGRPADRDTLFRIFSMTKAIGSAAAAILVDRGLLDLDTPVARILPEWNELQTIDGWDDGKPRLRKPVRQATVRHLATHTSGLEYEFWNEDVVRYMEATGHPSILSGLHISLRYPLMTEPGTRWGYGPGIDWLGRVVEAVDGRRIDAFCSEEIFSPLGMKDTKFETGAADARRLAAPAIRTAEGGFAPIEVSPPANPEFYSMGHALYSTAPDYTTFCRMILNGGTLGGRTILGDRAIRLMTTDQMQGLKFGRMASSSPLTADVDMFPGASAVHTFGYLMNEEQVPGRRSAGSLGWAGVMNSHYWIDPSRGITGVFMTQSLPFVEPPLMQFYKDFEEAVYATL